MIDLENEVEAAVFEFAEWLDLTGLMLSPEDSGDFRSHDDLAEAFLRHSGRR